MIDAGDYNKKISIYKIVQNKDNDGFPIKKEIVILKPYAKVKTTKGMTLIINDSDFEKAYTNFTIRYSKIVEDCYNSLEINRKLYIQYKNNKYTIEYLNNIDESNIELEMQAKKVVK